jgi:hypothetical protein
MSTDAEKVNSPKFEIYLGGVDLSADQAQKLEAALQKTAMQFLAKLDFAPKSDDVGAEAAIPYFQWQPAGPFIDRRWWFGWWIIRDFRNGGNIRFDLPRNVPGKLMPGRQF